MDICSRAALCQLFAVFFHYSDTLLNMILSQILALLSNTWIFFSSLQNHASCWAIIHSLWGCRQKILKTTDAALETGEQLSSLILMEVGRGMPVRIWWTGA